MIKTKVNQTVVFCSLVFFLLLPMCVFAQNYLRYEVDTIFQKVDIKPFYPGGNQALSLFFEENVRVDAVDREWLRNNDEVTLVELILDSTGAIVSRRVYESSYLKTNSKFASALEEMPAWLPAKFAGKRVKSRIIIPIRYEINAASQFRVINYGQEAQMVKSSKSNAPLKLLLAAAALGIMYSVFF